MSGLAEYAVVYDITNDRERARVAKVLKGFGFRVQKSVFECRLKRHERDALLLALERLQIETGFVKVYRLEYAKRPIIGHGPKEDVDGDSAYVV